MPERKIHPSTKLGLLLTELTLITAGTGCGNIISPTQPDIDRSENQPKAIEVLPDPGVGETPSKTTESESTQEQDTDILPTPTVYATQEAGTGTFCNIDAKQVLFNSEVDKLNKHKVIPVLSVSGLEEVFGVDNKDNVLPGLTSAVVDTVLNIAGSLHEGVDKVTIPEYIRKQDILDAANARFGSEELPFELDRYQQGQAIDGRLVSVDAATGGWTVSVWNNAGIGEDKQGSAQINGTLLSFEEDEQGRLNLVTIPGQFINDSRARVFIVDGCMSEVVRVGADGKVNAILNDEVNLITQVSEVWTGFAAGGAEEVISTKVEPTPTEEVKTPAEIAETLNWVGESQYIPGVEREYSQSEDGNFLIETRRKNDKKIDISVAKWDSEERKWVQTSSNEKYADLLPEDKTYVLSDHLILGLINVAEGNPDYRSFEIRGVVTGEKKSVSWTDPSSGEEENLYLFKVAFLDKNHQALELDVFLGAEEYNNAKMIYFEEHRDGGTIASVPFVGTVEEAADELDLGDVIKLTIPFIRPKNEIPYNAQCYDRPWFKYCTEPEQSEFYLFKKHGESISALQEDLWVGRNIDLNVNNLVIPTGHMRVLEYGLGGE